MARSKHGPALLEVIGRQKRAKHGGRSGQPGWRQAADANASVAQASAPAAGHRPDPETRGEARASTQIDSPPFCQIRGGRIVFAFSSAVAAMVLFAVAALVAGGWMAGRRTGVDQGKQLGFQAGVDSVQAKTLEGIEAARNARPNGDIFDGVGVSPIQEVSPQEKSPPTKKSASAKPSAIGRKIANALQDSSKWVIGHTYIVVQEFRAGDQADADAAQLFLKEHGVETEIVESKGSYRYVLLSVRGFNRDDPVQRKLCDKFHAEVKRLGKLFVKAGGRYALQGYQKKVTGEGS